MRCCNGQPEAFKAFRRELFDRLTARHGGFIAKLTGDWGGGGIFTDGRPGDVNAGHRWLEPRELAAPIEIEHAAIVDYKTVVEMRPIVQAPHGGSVPFKQKTVSQNLEPHKGCSTADADDWSLAVAAD